MKDDDDKIATDGSNEFKKLQGCFSDEGYHKCKADTITDLPKVQLRVPVKFLNVDILDGCDDSRF